jgi:hypothetical protein
VQGVFHIIGWLTREFGVEVAREAALRYMKGELKGMLASLDSRIVAEVSKVLSENAQVRTLLLQIQVGGYARSAIEQLTAPLVAQVQAGVMSIFQALANALPTEYADQARQMLDDCRAWVRAKLGNSVFVQVIQGLMEVVARTAVVLAAQFGMFKGIDMAKAKALTQALDHAKGLVGGIVAPISETAKPMLEEVKKLEDLADLIPLQAIRKPKRFIVKKGAEVLDELGLGGDPMPGVESADDALKVLEAKSQELNEKGAKVAQEHMATSNPQTAQLVKAGAIGLQTAFVLSELARAQTYTDTTIAILKPGSMVLASFIPGGFAPTAMAVAPVMIETTMRLLKNKIEPTLMLWGTTMAAYRPLKLTHDTAVGLGSMLNAIPGAMMSLCRGLLANVYGFFSNVGRLAIGGPVGGQQGGPQGVQQGGPGQLAPQGDLVQLANQLNIQVDLGGRIQALVQEQLLHEFAWDEDLQRLEDAERQRLLEEVD